MCPSSPHMFFILVYLDVSKVYMCVCVYDNTCTCIILLSIFIPQVRILNTRENKLN